MPDIAIMSDSVAEVANCAAAGRKLSDDVQIVAIVGGVIIAVASLLLDGELGYAMGTGILSLASYWIGRKGVV